MRPDPRALIRRAVAEHELVAVRNLHATLLPGVALPQGAAWWLAWARRRTVAFAGVVQTSEAGIWFLCRSGVLPSSRGHRLQRRLIRVREAFVRRAGGRELVTYTSRWNLPSANNLLACGYRLYKPPEEWGIEGGMYFSRRLDR